MVLTDLVPSEGKRGPTRLERELHIERTDTNTWRLQITGPRGGAQEGVILSRAGLKTLFERMLAEL